MKQILTMMALGILWISSLAQEGVRTYIADDGLYPRAHFADFTRLDLDVKFDVRKGAVFGTVVHTFTVIRENTDSLFLDAPGIRFSSVLLDGKKIRYKVNDSGIICYFSKKLPYGTEHKLRLSYSATPKRGLYFIGWNDSLNLSRKQIWTQGQGIDNRYWIPVFDDRSEKLISALRITFDKNYRVVSNGIKKLEKDNGDGTKTWEYEIAHPHTPYLIMIAIGKYGIDEQKGPHGVPLYRYYYPGEEEKIKPTYQNTADIMSFFEEEMGVPYPWSSYSQIPVQEFLYGAMENTTATIYGDFYFVDARAALDKAFLGVEAHEMAHQWFGDYVTARSDAHHWLQESFATFYNMNYERKIYGDNYYDWKRRQATESSLSESEKNLKPVACSTAGSVRHYPKGAHVLDMLRYVVGDDAFKRAIKHYLNAHPYGSVDSEDLLTAFYESTGMPLDWFWDEWIYKGGEPHYSVKFEGMLQKDGRYFNRFTVSQTQKLTPLNSLFRMPVQFQVWYKDGYKDERTVTLQGPQQVVDVPFTNAARAEESRQVAYALFDPDSRVMSKVDFPKDFDMLSAQARKAEYMLDRLDAVKAMKDVALAQKETVLLETVNDKKEYHLVRNEALSQLRKSGYFEEVCGRALKDHDFRVRQFAINQLNPIPLALRDAASALLKDSSYVTVASCLRRLCTDFPEQAQEYISQVGGVEGALGRNVAVTQAEMMAVYGSRDAAYRKLVNWCSRSYEFRTRVNAAQALERLDYCDKMLVMNLVDAMGSSNGRLARPCTAVLRSLYRNPRHQKMINDVIAGLKRTADEKSALLQKLQAS